MTKKNDFVEDLSGLWKKTPQSAIEIRKAIL